MSFTLLQTSLSVLRDWRLTPSIMGSLGLLVFFHCLMDWVWDLGCASILPALCAVLGVVGFQVGCCLMVSPAAGFVKTDALMVRQPKKACSTCCAVLA